MWQEIAFQIEDQEMPPEEESQPSEELKNKVVNELHDQVELAMKGMNKTSLTLRRLNKTQYSNTIRDLLKIDIKDSPSRSFPEDGHFEGFDSVSDYLKMSEFLLKQMYMSASESLDRATFSSKPILAEQKELKKLNPRSIMKKGIKI